ncbi:MAG TPA: hypothetical protein C5S50_03085 [Methanosarcinaceae archaeon]|nr:hypothetical protein [Methanosarcinaceae archaeon]
MDVCSWQELILGKKTDVPESDYAAGAHIYLENSKVNAQQLPITGTGQIPVGQHYSTWNRESIAWNSSAAIVNEANVIAAVIETYCPQTADIHLREIAQYYTGYASHVTQVSHSM